MLHFESLAKHLKQGLFVQVHVMDSHSDEMYASQFFHNQLDCLTTTHGKNNLSVLRTIMSELTNRAMYTWHTVCITQ